jgi:hypothetical protein
MNSNKNLSIIKSGEIFKYLYGWYFDEELRNPFPIHLDHRYCMDE